MLAALLAIALTDSPKLVKPPSLVLGSRQDRTRVWVDYELSAPAPEAFVFEGPEGKTTIGDGTQQEGAGHYLVSPPGLKVDSLYKYSLPGLGVHGSFMSPPARGSLTPFTFAVVGDARDHAKWAELAHAILEKHPRFILDTGDNIEGGDSQEAWRDFYVAGAELFANTPYFATRGNHDRGATYEEYNRAFSAGVGPSTYAFQYGNAGFIAIDSNSPEDGPQQAFVARALKAMKGGPIFVFQHHPLYSCGGHGNSESMQRAFKALFEQAHVAMDFAGHDHDLIDWKPLNGVRYVVSGGGGTTVYPLFLCGDAAFAKQSFGFVLVTVAGAKVTAVFYDEHGIELFRDAFDAAGPSIPAVDLAAIAHSK